MIERHLTRYEKKGIQAVTIYYIIAIISIIIFIIIIVLYIIIIHFIVIGKIGRGS